MYRRLRNPQIASVIVCSKWDRMVYNTVLTAEKRGPQIVGAQIAGVYCTKNLTTPFPSWLDVPDVLLTSVICINHIRCTQDVLHKHFVKTAAIRGSVIVLTTL